MATVLLSWQNAADTSDHSQIQIYRYESTGLVTDSILKLSPNEIAAPSVGAPGSTQTYEDDGAELDKGYCYGVYSRNGGGVSNIGDKVHINVT